MRDEDEDKKHDSDRAAILARRKRFIALTLSGLATTAFTSGCDQGEEADGKAEPQKPESPPQPCLSIEPSPPEDQPEQPPPEDQQPPPQPCLKVAPPQPEGETGVADEPPPEPQPDPKPRPCLKKAAPEPKPCLRMPAPTND